MKNESINKLIGINNEVSFYDKIRVALFIITCLMVVYIGICVIDWN